MKVLAGYELIGLVFISLLLFYFFGGGQFADYNNYLRIADGDGFAVSESDYVFEWLSRYFLSLTGLSSSGRVAVLAFVNQVVCAAFFIWAATRVRVGAIYGVLLLFCIFGFLFMTTTLRASPAYLSVSAFYIRGGRFDIGGVALLIFALAWHDSAAPILLICVAASFFSFFLKNELEESVGYLFLVPLVVLSVVVVLFSDFLRAYLVLSLPLDLGARAAYFEGGGDHGLLKELFIIFSMVCCLSFVLDRRESLVVRLFVSLLSVAVCMSYLVSAVAAVRLALYMYVVMLPLRGVFIFEFEKRSELRFFLLLCSPLIYAISAAGVLVV